MFTFTITPKIKRIRGFLAKYYILSAAWKMLQQNSMTMLTNMLLSFRRGSAMLERTLDYFILSVISSSNMCGFISPLNKTACLMQ